jgi:isoamylase
LQGGDEMGRTQQGNNNAYCQDNEISWFDWTSLDADLLNFAREVVAIRRRHPVLRRRRFVGGAGAGDVQWFTPVGSAMTEADWNAGWTRSVVMYADGKRDPDRDERGRPILDDDLLLLINGWWEPLTFTLPDVGAPRTWERELDTFDGTAGEGHGGPAGGVTQLRSGSDVTLGPRSLVLLKAASPA